jgi:hypothetical protein
MRWRISRRWRTFFSQPSARTAHQATGALQPAWDQVLTAMRLKGTATGSQAASSIEQLMARAQTAMRDRRAVGLRGMQAMMQSYATLVSGVLIGMSEGLQPGTSEPKSRKK